LEQGVDERAQLNRTNIVRDGERRIRHRNAEEKESMSDTLKKYTPRREQQKQQNGYKLTQSTI
jgi:hypothetical protein